MIRPRDFSEARRLRDLWWDRTLPVDDSPNNGGAGECRVEAHPGRKVIARTDQGTLVVPLVYAAELSACDPFLRCDGICLPENFLWHRTCSTRGCIAHAEPRPAQGFSSHSHAPQPPANVRSGGTASLPPAGDDGGASLGINAPRLDALRPLPAKSGRHDRAGGNHARFSDEQARAIIDLRYRQGWTYSRIAAHVGAPMSTVIGLLRGKSYRDLLPPDVLERARQRRDDLEAIGQHA